MNTPLTPEQQAQLDATRLQAAKNALYAACRFNSEDFAVDEDNRAALILLSHWLIGKRHSEMVDQVQQDGSHTVLPFEVVPGKGVMLMGQVGTGKTAMMRSLSYAHVKGGGQGFQIANSIRIVKEYNHHDTGGDAVIMSYATKPVLCIDDLAREDDGKHYGKITNVIADIINLRYDHGLPTYYTTNADGATLLAKYDERTVSRIQQQVCIVPLGGDDRRADAVPPSSKEPALFMPEPPMPTEEEMEASRKRREEIKAQFPHLYAPMSPTARTGSISKLRDVLGVPEEAMKEANALLGGNPIKLELDKPLLPALPITDDNFVTWASNLGTLTDEQLGLERMRVLTAKLKDPVKFLQALDQEIADRKAELEAEPK